MNRVQKAITFLAVALFHAVAIASTYICPVDKQTMWETGRVRVEMGTMLYEVRCAFGHTAWVAH